MSFKIYSYEDIAAKAEWEGGLDEALEWFQANQVPLAIQSLWSTAKSQKDDLVNTLQYIENIMVENGVDW